MKNYSLLFYFIFGMITWTFAIDQERILQKSIPVYSLNIERPVVTLPTNFAEPFIIDEKDLKTLNSNEIFQVDLVYTKYRESADFDQEALNQRRIRQLMKLVPTVDLNRPNWNFIEQTKAMDRTTAKSYFHGFVIHYRPTSVDHEELQSRFKKYQDQTEQYQVNAQQGAELSYPSGTVIHIPKNAVSYPDGTPVEGDFELTYTEFRNPAEIALSGIPMTYNDHGENLNFSSIGMYEIKGEKNGQDLQLNQPITIDFNATKVVDDADFYQLNEATQTWEKIEPVIFGGEDNTSDSNDNTSDNRNIVSEQFSIVSGDEQVVYDFYKEGWTMSTWTNDQGAEVILKNGKDNKVIATLNQNAWNVYQKLKRDPQIAELIVSELPDDRKVELVRETAADFSNSIVTGQYIVAGFNPMNTIALGQVGAISTNSSQDLQTAQLFAGHTYPTLVQGLRTANFGVYNCDQVYRMGRTQTISPVYVDAGTSLPINSAHVTCVMDLNKNGSFSFDPNFVTLNPNGRNALLLFTMDDHVYYYDPASMRQADLSSGEPTLYMKDVTDQIKSSKDLEKLLKI